MLLLAIAAPSVADVLDTPTPTPAATGTIQGMQYAKYGSGQPALVLVPGLGAGIWTWRDTIARESRHHTVYAVTLPGFDGLPLVTNAGIDLADADLLALITGEKLDRPVLIGHSLGGFLALRFATEHANLLRGDVSVDGPPVFIPLATASAEERKTYGERFSATILAQTQESFESGVARYVRDYVTDPALAARVTTLTERSDRTAIALYSKELFSRDLRPELSKLTVSTLVVAPVPGIPLPTFLPAEMAQMSLDQRRAATVSLYQSLMTGAPHVQVVPIDNARHFAMLDQPDAFANAIDAFIQTLQ